jgi:hypothetical protein
MLVEFLEEIAKALIGFFLGSQELLILHISHRPAGIG